MKHIFIYTSAIILALTGCISPGNSDSTSSSAPPPPTLVVQSTPPAKPQASPGALIVLQRSGGLAGTQEEWTIYPDGRIVDSTGKEAQTTPEQVAALLSQIDSLGFFELDESYVPRDTCCDRFTYVLTVQADGKTHSVTALEAEPSVPQAFWQAVQAVDQLIASLNPK
jgi:hypothetical protein